MVAPPMVTSSQSPAGVAPLDVPLPRTSSEVPLMVSVPPSIAQPVAPWSASRYWFSVSDAPSHTLRVAASGLTVSVAPSTV